jgi:hypothetical protein
MDTTSAQAHHQFKVFSGPASADGSLGSLGAEVEAFVRDRGVAPKSIGVEYLEAVGRLVVSLGFRSDEPGYPIRLQAQSCGKIDDPSDLSGLESRMAEVAAGMNDVLCHELFVTSEGEFVMVFMARA